MEKSLNYSKIIETSASDTYYKFNKFEQVQIIG